MKRSFLVTTAAFALLGLTAGPGLAPSAFARSNNLGSQTSNQNNGSRQSADQIVNDAVQTVQQMKADGHFAKLLNQSKGVFIMPSLVKGALLVGGQGAQGVLLKHTSDGHWSDPVFLTLGSISVGLQAGGKAGPAAMILMTDKALNDLTQANNFSFGANAGLTIVTYSAQGQAPVGKGDIIVWSNQSGVFGGADINGADVTQNTSADHAYYHKNVNARQILAGQAANPQADKLRAELPT